MSGIMQMIARHKVPSAASAAISTIFDFSNPPQLVSAQFNGTSHQLLANSSVFTETNDTLEWCPNCWTSYRSIQ